MKKPLKSQQDAQDQAFFEPSICVYLISKLHPKESLSVI